MKKQKNKKTIEALIYYVKNNGLCHQKYKCGDCPLDVRQEGELIGCYLGLQVGGDEARMFYQQYRKDKIELAKAILSESGCTDVLVDIFL